MEKLLLTIFFFTITLTCKSQNLKKDETAQLLLKSNGVISTRGVVSGYYFFYQTEKSTQSTNNYLLEVLDEDFSEINHVTFSKPFSYKLIETIYNGRAYLFLFFDHVGKKTNLLSFDDNLTQIGEFDEEITNKIMLENYGDLVNGFDTGEKYLSPIENIGFIQFQNGLITAYDNKLNEIWFERVSGQPSDAFQSREKFGYLITRTFTDKRYVEYDVLINNPISGQREAVVSIKSAMHSILPLSINYDSANRNIIVFGNFFNKRDNPLEDNSLGFCTIIYDLKGAYVSSKTILNDDLKRKSIVNYNNNRDSLRQNILFHDFIRTSDGKMFAVGEEYIKKTSVGKMLLSRYSPPVHINVYNLVVFEISANHELEKTHIINKNKSKLFFGHLRMFSSHKTLSRIVKKAGGFDYRFSQEHPGNEIFSIIYKDTDLHNREEVLGTITYTPEKKLKLNKVKFKSKISSIEVFPAKPGYLLLAEFLNYSKEKKVDVRLEKINY